MTNPTTISKPIYLDYNATTPIAPEVAEAMLPYLQEHFGNPSSSHYYGVQTKKAIEQARKQVANLLHCEADEIVFTSGGSESNNYAIKGYALANQERGDHIITTQIEHPAVLEVCRYLEWHGFTETYVPVDEYGMVNIDTIRKAITLQTILISVMHANNEVGTIQPIPEIVEFAKPYGIVVHTDAAQSVGKIPVRVDQLEWTYCQSPDISFMLLKVLELYLSGMESSWKNLCMGPVMNEITGPARKMFWKLLDLAKRVKSRSVI